MTDPSPSPARSCGACTLCCKLLGIHELEKPQGAWCGHCKPGKGCGIYEARPPSCRTFTCGWLADLSIPEAMRPDRSKVVLYFTTTGDRMIAACDPAQPMAWRKEPLYSQLRLWGAQAWARKRMVMVTIGERTILLTPRNEVDLGVLDPDARLAIAEWPDGRVDVKVEAPAPA